MKEELKNRIPKQSFGRCNWCGTESTRLMYLMCPKCTRIFNLVPSKTMVRLNNPEVKKRIQALGRATVRTITPEVRNFVMDPASRFPPESSDKEHWNTMIEEALDNLTENEVEERVAYMREVGIDLGSIEEVETGLAVDNVIRFMITVGVITNKLKLDIDAKSALEFEDTCDYCLESAKVDSSEQPKRQGQPEPDSSSPRAGMNISDRIKNRR